MADQLKTLGWQQPAQKRCLGSWVLHQTLSPEKVVAPVCNRTAVHKRVSACCHHSFGGRCTLTSRAFIGMGATQADTGAQWHSRGRRFPHKLDMVIMGLCPLLRFSKLAFWWFCSCVSDCVENQPAKKAETQAKRLSLCFKRTPKAWCTRTA